MYRVFQNHLNANSHLPYMAQENSAIDECATRHNGYIVSLCKHKRIEKIFRWLRTVGDLRKTRHRGVSQGTMDFHFCICGLQCSTNEKSGGLCGLMSGKPL